MLDYETLSNLGDNVDIYMHCDTLQEAYERIKPYEELGKVKMESFFAPSLGQHVQKLKICKETEKGEISIVAFYQND